MKRNKNNSLIAIKEKTYTKIAGDQSKKALLKKSEPERKSRKENIKKMKEPMLIDSKQDLYFVKKRAESKSKRSKSVLFQHKQKNNNVTQQGTCRNTFINNSKEKHSKEATNFSVEQKTQQHNIDQLQKSLESMTSNYLSPCPLNHQPDYLQEKVLQNQNKINTLEVSYKEIREECEILKNFTKDLREENRFIRQEKHVFGEQLKMKDQKAKELVQRYELQKQVIVEAFQVQKKAFFSQISYLKSHLHQVQHQNQTLKQSLAKQKQKTKQLVIQNQELQVRCSQVQQIKEGLLLNKGESEIRIKRLQQQIGVYHINGEGYTRQKKRYEQRLIDLQMQKVKIKRYACQLLDMLKECKKVDNE